MSSRLTLNLVCAMNSSPSRRWRAAREHLPNFVLPNLSPSQLIRAIRRLESSLRNYAPRWDRWDVTGKGRLRSAGAGIFADRSTREPIISPSGPLFPSTTWGPHPGGLSDNPDPVPTSLMPSIRNRVILTFNPACKAAYRRVQYIPNQPVLQVELRGPA